MPTGARIRENSVFGTVADNPLSPGATTLNSNQLVLFPVISGDHAVITLDPLRQYGDPEIVVITAHTAAATTVTIQRGQYGTIAREHPFGTVWVHALLDEDCIEVLTSGTRPTNPYYGQTIFESDTDKFVGRSIGGVWQDVVPLGAWVDWTPSFTGFTLGNGTVVAKYKKVGRHVFYHMHVTLGTTSSVTGTLTTSLPATVSTNYASGQSSIGYADLLDSGVASYRGVIRYENSGNHLILCDKIFSVSFVVQAVVNATQPFTWTTGDVISVNGNYEAAS